MSIGENKPPTTTNRSSSMAVAAEELFVLGEVGACTLDDDDDDKRHFVFSGHANSQFCMTTKLKVSSCRQEWHRHTQLFLLQAFRWTTGSIPRQRNERRSELCHTQPYFLPFTEKKTNDTHAPPSCLTVFHLATP